MYLQLAGTNGCITAFVTFVWLDTPMNPLVLNQVTLRFGLVVTKVTRVWSFPGVRTHVQVQTVSGLTRIRTEETFEWFLPRMSFKMTFQKSSIV